MGSPTGLLSQATGRAINDDYSHAPGKFRLTFDSVKSPLAGFFWIVDLGEIEPGQSQYPYAVVSVPFQTSLFILARDVDKFRLKYKDLVLKIVENKGFVYFLNKPMETYHSAFWSVPLPTLTRDRLSPTKVQSITF